MSPAKACLLLLLVIETPLLVGCAIAAFVKTLRMTPEQRRAPMQDLGKNMGHGFVRFLRALMITTAITLAALKLVP